METLSLSILQNRNTFLKQFSGENLESISKKLDNLFEIEKDQVKRIVLLASRVETIRKRIEKINLNEPKQEKAKEVISPENETPVDSPKVNDQQDNKDEWVKVVMKESAEVNGVRFPEGIQIDVSNEDSERLIKTGKAAII